MAASLQKLKRLPDSLLVYAGHGETTLLGHEKKFNPFLTGAYSLF
jgi:glyoxylase-like metal-dependent hydrolase (beta-lactamase superfamily II)